jgi:cobyrinic acid a,c-diamide synthase
VIGVLIAGTASGVGKTTIALAITAAMRRRGLEVQACKGGPDFLDTGHHTRVSGRAAYNVDTWMLSADANEEVFRRACLGADAIVVEGMMGLFDGKDGTSESGSSAEIAKLLRLPVVLVLDAGKSARSLAAVVLGFERFDPELPLAGIILNKVASDGHFRMLETAIKASCKTPLLGWFPREPAVTIPERHLGLQSAQEASDGDELETLIDTLAELAEKHCDMAQILRLRCSLERNAVPLGPILVKPDQVRIGVARDRAFSFYYEDNFDLLREHGATIVPFSPLQDELLPRDLDALFLGGGYPELYANQLSANLRMVSGIRDFVACGRPVYAECGGMIYLSRQLITSDGTVHKMAGVLPLEIEMTGKLVNFGYVTVKLTGDCLLGRKGTRIRGHSFHYSRIAAHEALRTSYRVTYSLSGKEENEGFTAGSILASYIHLHFRAHPDVARHFFEAAMAARSRDLLTR